MLSEGNMTARDSGTRPGTEQRMLDEDISANRAFLSRLSATHEARALAGALMSTVRRQCFAALAEPPTAEATAIATQLAVEGIADLGILLEPARAAAMLGHFRARPLYEGHALENSDGVPRDFDQVRRAAHYGCHGKEDILTCPHLLEIANDPHLLQIAEAYLGCPPTIYSLNAWWSFAHAGRAAQWSQALHRDLEELRFVTMFIYLTPVDEKSGAHRYIKHSHNQDALASALAGQGWPPDAIATTVKSVFHGTGYEFSTEADALLGHLAKVWTGPAGSAIMADTYGLHMGIPLVEGERLMLWVRYGLGTGPNTFGGGSGKCAPIVEARIPPTDRARYINRLLLTD